MLSDEHQDTKKKEQHSSSSGTRGYQANDSLEHKTSDKSLYEILSFKIKNNRLAALSLIVCAVFIGFASFTDSITKLDTFYDKYFRLEIEMSPLTLFLNKSRQTKASFSIANTQNKGSIELTSISATQLVSVDLCRWCSFLARTKLKLVLADGGKVKTGSFELFDSENNTMFGELGVYSLSPGESAPFSIQVSTGGDRGSVFHLTLSGNDLNKSQQFELIPPYLFYFVGPPDYRDESLKSFSFDSWKDEKDSYLRTNAAIALGNLKDSRGEPSLLIAAKNDENTEVRVASIGALSVFDSNKSFEFLIATLSGEIGEKVEENEDLAKIRRAAARALGNRNDIRASSYLLNAWKIDRGFWVANESIKSYGKLNPPGALSKLTNILGQHDSGIPPEWHNRSSIVEALGFLTDSGATKVLIQQLFYDSKQFEDHWSRSAAARALRKCHKADCIAALTKASENGSDLYSRKEAIESLGILQATSALATLKSISTSDPEEDIRYAAERSIQKINDINH